MKKIHAIACGYGPSEGNTEDDSYILCDPDGQYGEIKDTRDWEKVTCKKCLQRIQYMKENPQHY